MKIGISGKKLSGKDTFFQIAQEVFAKEAPHARLHRYAFADLVKQYAATYFNIDPRVSGEEKERVRFVWQGIGQMLREEVDEDYWVKKVFEQIDQDGQEYMSAYPDSIFIGIITDVRYKNEARLIEEDGNSLLLRINRPSLTFDDQHASEIDLDDYTFTYEIENTGDLIQYKGQVIEWLYKNLPLLSLS